MPPAARVACDLYRLPTEPTQADLEIGYATRGAQIVACDAARDLAVQVHAGEHADEATWRQTLCHQRRGWRFWQSCREPTP